MIAKNNLIFFLGAPDAEMVLIEKILRHYDIGYGFVMSGGDRVRGGSAYQPDGINEDLFEDPINATREVTLVTVECNVPFDTANFRLIKVDHHQPGDSGFGKPPSEYAEASSIGQVVNFLEGLGLPVSTDFPKWKLVAAGDHCPAAAYQGACPGISVEEFREFRIRGAAEFQKKSFEALSAEIAHGMDILRDCEDVHHLGVTWKNAMGIEVPQLPHVAAMLAMPASYSMYLEREDRTKVGIIGSDDPTVVRAWIDFHANTLVDQYGDPARGYAGGYLPKVEAVTEM